MIKECVAPWPTYRDCPGRDGMIREGIIRCLAVGSCPYGQYDAEVNCSQVFYNGIHEENRGT